MATKIRVAAVVVVVALVLVPPLLVDGTLYAVIGRRVIPAFAAPIRVVTVLAPLLCQLKNASYY